MRLILFTLLFVISSSWAAVYEEDQYNHPFYLGVMGGYGTTTWSGLVPAANNQTPGLSVSTPIDANEGGATWGFFIGYDLTKYFGFEASYMRYPDAIVNFDEDSLFVFDHNVNHFKTSTSVLDFVGRIMVTVPHTKLRLYSGAGVAGVHRKDILDNETLITPTFVLGAKYHIQPQMMAEIGGNFTVGYAEASMNPSDDFIPFLYSVVLKIAYLI